MSVRVLIADDHQAVRVGLSTVLNGSNLEVMAQAVNYDEAVRFAIALHPDLALIDLRMPGGNGWDAIRDIKTHCPAVLIIVFTASESVPAMVRAYEAGADGYVSKGAGAGQLLKTVGRAVGGKRAWSRRQLQQIGTAKRRTYGFDDYLGLTKREAEVLAAVSRGLTNEEVSEELGLALDTVKQHMKRLIAKLAVADRTQAALWALRHGAPLASQNS
jgi:DNA-binding NarL/FixJ family response regulator